MWYIQELNSKDRFYLLNDIEKYSIGRINSDLIIENDSSISRIHAHLRPKKDCVELLDHNSTYGTFINEGIINDKSIAKNSSFTLRENDKIRFGRLKSLWQLNRQPIVTLISSLNDIEKCSLVEYMNTLNGTIADQWSENCTHLTISNITATVKVLLSLTNAKPIVLPSYWMAYIKSVKEKKPIPDPSQYLPPIGESFLNDDCSFAINVDRKRLFAGKTFIFFRRKQLAIYGPIVQSAGGDCYSLDEKAVRKSTFSQPENIVIQYIPPAESQSNRNVNDVTEYLIKMNRRTIPDCEIGLAILYCSIEQFCNPLYKMENNFDGKTTLIESDNFIVPGTEDNKNGNGGINEDINIPETAASDIVMMDGNEDISNDFLGPNSQADGDSPIFDLPKIGSIQNRSPNKIIESQLPKVVRNTQDPCSQFVRKRKPTEYPPALLEAFKKQKTNDCPPENMVANQKRINLLETNGDSDDDDNGLFSFANKPTIKKRPLQNETDDRPFEFSTMPAKRTKQYDDNQPIDTESIKDDPIKKLDDITSFQYEPIKITTGGWLNRSSFIKCEEPDELNESKKWFDSIRDGFVSKFSKLVVKCHPEESIDCLDNSKAKNYKKFVKKNNYRPQTSVVRTTPINIATLNSLGF